MVKITNADLSAKPVGDDIIFTINTTFKFEEYEKGIDWELTMNFIEYDKYSRNEKIRKIKQILKPSELEEFEQGKRFEEKIPKEKVDTEWGYEEVLVELNLEPIQKPSPDSMETTKVNINV